MQLACIIIISKTLTRDKMSRARYLRRRTKRLYNKLKPTLQLLTSETERMIMQYPEDSAVLSATIELCNDRWVQVCKNNNAVQLVDLYVMNINRINNELKNKQQDEVKKEDK